MLRPKPLAFAIATLITLGVAGLGMLYNFLPSTRIFVRERGVWRAAGTVHGAAANRLAWVGHELWATASLAPAAGPPVLLPPRREIVCPDVCRMVHSQGMVWAMSETALYRFDGWLWWKVPHWTGRAARNYSMATDGQTIWVSDSKGLLWTHRSGQWWEDNAPERTTRLSLAWTPAGLWAAGSQLWLRSDNGEWKRVLVNGGVPRIVDAHGHVVWVQAGERLIAYRSAGEPVQDFPHKSRVRQVAQAGDEIWVLAEAGGVTTFARNVARRVALPRESGEAQGIAADAAGRLWLGGWVGGGWSPLGSDFFADWFPALVMVAILGIPCAYQWPSWCVFLLFWGAGAWRVLLVESAPALLLTSFGVIPLLLLCVVGFKLWRLAADKRLLVPAWCLAVAAALWTEFVFTHGGLLSLKRWLAIGGYGELVALAINCGVVTVMVSAALSLKRRVRPVS